MARRLIALLAVAVCAGALAGPASAAAPRYIMVSGGALAKPILLADWTENLRFETAVLLAPKVEHPAKLPLRSRLTLSLFWGWGEHRPKSPSQANQRGWLYPAAGSRPALIALGVNGRSQLRVVSGPLLRILERHAVPTGQVSRPAAATS
jgi:hypothetical protein